MMMVIGMGMVLTNSKPSPRLKRPSMLKLFKMSHTTSNLIMHSRYPHIYMRKIRPGVSIC